MITKPTKAILDGDIIAYKAAFWAESDGPEYLEDRLKHDVKAWTPAGCDTIEIALSCTRDTNFRRRWLPEYKAHRGARVTPTYLKDAMAYLEQSFPSVRAAHLEADDLMGIATARGEAICVTIDKDLRTVPGYHWKPTAEGEFPRDVEYICEQSADYTFHRQWITGDATDNIGGIWKMGPQKAEDALNSVNPLEWTHCVMALYEQRPNKEGGKYTLKDAIAQAKGVRILRSYDEMFWMPAGYQ